MISLGIGLSAQTNIAGYSFTKSTGAAYTPITGGTVFASGTYDDSVSPAITLSSPFPFGGTTVTTCYISTNGFITFGGAPLTYTYSPLSTLDTGTLGAVAAFGQDAGADPTMNTSASPEIRYQDLGTEFVVQYKDHANYYNRSTEKLNFQIHLVYATGEINIVYGNNSNPGTVSTSGTTPQVGIRGNSVAYATNVNNLMIGNVPAGTTCDWSKAVTGNANTSTMLFSGTANANVKIPTGLKYTWMPGTQLPVRTFAATTGVTNSGATLNWTAPSGATAYNLQYRVAGNCDWTSFLGNPVSAATATLTGLAQNTTYQVQVQALNGNAQSIYSHIPDLAGTGNGYAAAGSFTTVANCPSVVTALTSSNVSTTTATIGWTAPASVPASGYEYYYSTSPTAPFNTTPASGSVAAGAVTANLSGLTTATQYYFWVRTNCNGTDKGSWVGSSSFITLCNPFPIPYSENFDTTPVGSSTNTNAPTCWKYLEPSGWAGYGYVYGSYYTSAPNGYYISSDAASTGGGMLVSPVTTNLMSGSNRVRFQANAGGSGYTMEVGTLSDPNDASTFTAIGSPIALTTAFTQYVVNIPSGTSQYLAFRHSGGGTYRSIRLDDINVEPVPSCLEVSGLASANVSALQASLSWNASASAPANGYDIYYSTANTAPSSTTTPTVSANSSTTYTASGLAPSTAYYVWVRSNCSATNKSIWTGPVSFTTSSLCPAVTAPASGAQGLSTAPTITWDAMPSATGYRLTVGTTSGGTDVLNNVDLGNVTSYTFAAPLAANTKYYYVVNAYAGNAVSSSCTIRNFTTACSSTISSLPWTENFDGLTTLGSQIAPSCWVVGAGTKSWTSMNASSTSFNTPKSAPNYMTLQYGSTDPSQLWTPIFQLTANTSYTFSFYYNTNGTSSGFIGYTGNVVVNNTQSMTGATDLGTFITATQGTTAYTQYTVNFTPSVSGKYTFGVNVSSTGSPWYLGVDDFSLTQSTLGTSEVAANDKNVKVYPNPFSEILNISDATNVKNILVTDVAGRLVKTIANPSQELRLGELQQGMYLITLEMKDGSKQTVKAIKK
ncbi:hypothetical protein CHA01nite_20680 [Chryseobacterium hagamense]|uniref:Fibronectin type-III domain-containing protein n=2 Tax=Chryseobacterium hagamense TaxID=395935 RepID=A0A511YMB4_9FLAO|nr:hypothetical protein CHA01nite_20680 [Chryseobacterium hagamense]